MKVKLTLQTGKEIELTEVEIDEIVRIFGKPTQPLYIPYNVPTPTTPYYPKPWWESPICTSKCA